VKTINPKMEDLLPIMEYQRYRFHEAKQKCIIIAKPDMIGPDI